MVMVAQPPDGDAELTRHSGARARLRRALLSFHRGLVAPGRGVEPGSEDNVNTTPPGGAIPIAVSLQPREGGWQTNVAAVTFPSRRQVWRAAVSGHFSWTAFRP